MVSILIIGAGELGLAVLEGLVMHPDRGADDKLGVLLREPTIASTDPAKLMRNARLRDWGVSLEAGNVETDGIDVLAAAFKPFHTVICCFGMTGAKGVQVKITEAVLAARVRRYIPWQFGVDYDVLGRDSSQDTFDEQLDVRGLLQGQYKTEWVIFSTGMFMSFLFENFFGVVSEDWKTVNALGGWGNKVTVTTVQDIGRMTAEVVWKGWDEVKNQVVFIAGDTLSYAELADILDRMGETARVQRQEWTVPLLKAELAKDPGDGIKKYRVVFAEGKGVSWDKEETLNARLGIKLQSVREWVRASLE